MVNDPDPPIVPAGLPPDTPQPSGTALAAFLAGARAVSPILLADIPFGLIYGITALEAGMSPLLAQAMSFIVFAGSAQLVIAQLVREATPALIIVIIAFVVNLRHVLYSASIASYLQHLSGRWKALLAYLLTDEAYVVAITHYEQAKKNGRRRWYFLGAGLTLWTTWQLVTAAGVFLSASVPTSLPLDFALPLIFIALLVPVIRDRAGVVAALTAGVVVLLTMALPFRLNLLLAAAAGLIAGLRVEAMTKR